MSVPKIIVGIDPDADKHGFAVYKQENQRTTLCELSQRNLMEIMDFLIPYENTQTLHTLLFSIEDVMANQFVYERNKHDSKAAQSKIAMNTGRCQQSQVELVRMLDYADVKYVLHPPQKDNWANNEKLFMLATSWKGSSNADKRSAAFFGYLAI